MSEDVVWKLKEEHRVEMEVRWVGKRSGYDREVEAEDRGLECQAMCKGPG